MLHRLVAAFDRAAAFVACALVVALLVCVSLGVLTRTWGDPLIWTDELSRFLMVWLAVFGWVLASRKGIHVRIRFLQDKLPQRAHHAVEVVLQSAVTLFGALVCAYGVGLVAKNHDLEATSMPLSMAWLYAPIVLAGVVTALQGAREVAAALAKPKPPSADGAAR
jgi:TRAP-type C4-dicarboxylate transport system permease small subunit